MCEGDITREEAQGMLDESIVYGQRRYAVRNERAYSGAEHRLGHWHGWPVGWKEVPPAIFTQFQEQGKVSKRSRRQFWDGH